MAVIKEITPAETHPIRRLVLRDNRPVSVYFNGDEAALSFHLGILKDDEIVGIASFMAHPNDAFSEKRQYQLRGMAILSELRGKGLGVALLNKGIAILKERQTDLLWCNARVVAVPFYEKLGFSIVGGVFEVPKIGPHYKMKFKIKP